MRKTLVIAVLSVLAIYSSVLAKGWAGCPGMEGKKGTAMNGGGASMILSMASELNLTAEQMEKLKKLADEKKIHYANRDEMKKYREEMRAEMQKEKPDQAKIDLIIDRMAEKKKAAMKQRSAHMLKVHEILTKEQRDILMKKMEDKKGMFAGKKKACMPK
ncbi:MAG TPA: periplasmic heavy metal sensor [Candidatus Goldiibacteriota bacterium]|nr:periplasmic heavy metal sensor [Candidatus Goldiibacteriota bacterium]